MGKKILMILCGTLCLAVLSTACGKKPSQEEKKKEETQYADKEYVEAMSEGLQARWELNRKDEEKEGYDEILINSQENKNMMLSYIDAELDKIEKYQDEKFEDSKLKELAISYINLLKDHEEICEYMTVDYDKYLEDYEPVYNGRSIIIAQMVDDYNLTVDEEYKDNLSQFQTNSTLVQENEKREAETKALLDGIQFELVEDDGYGWKTYQATVENTTSMDFKTLNLSINLLNEEGVIVETTYDSVSAFNKGSKVQFEFMTEKDFVSTQVTADWWE